MAKDCVERGGLSPAGYNSYIRASAAIGNGQTANLTAGSCPAGSVTATAHETMDYTLRQGHRDDRHHPEPAGNSEVVQLSAGVIFPFTFSACAFPDSFTTGNATTPGTHSCSTARASARPAPATATPPARAATPRVSSTDGCVLSRSAKPCTTPTATASPARAVTHRTWTPMSARTCSCRCGGQRPVAVAAVTTPSPTWSGFHVLGWSGNGSGRAER